MDESKIGLSRRRFLGVSTVAGLGFAVGSPAHCAVRGDNIANIRVTGSPTGTTAHIQPTIALNPRSPQRLFGACYAWLDGWDSRNKLATYTSADGGRSWQGGSLLGSDELNDHGVAYGRDGIGYIWADDGTLRVWRTENDGRTFQEPVLCAQDARIDRAVLAANQDRRLAKHVYGVWGTDNNEAIGFSQSTDGARTFEPTRRIAHGQGVGAEWTVCPEISARQDVVHVSYGLWPRPEKTSNSGEGQPTRGEMTGPIMVTTSRDGGTTFNVPIQLGVGTIDLQVAADTCTPSIPSVAIGPDPRVAAIVYTQREEHSADLVMCTTVDAGRSWSPPTKITTSPAEVLYYQPRLACSPTERFALSAYRIANNRVDSVLFSCPPERPRFSSMRTITTRAFDPTIGPPGKNGAWWLGDSQAVAASTHAIHPVWTDTRDGHLEVFTAIVPYQ